MKSIQRSSFSQNWLSSSVLKTSRSGNAQLMPSTHLCLSFHFLCSFDLVFVTALFETRGVEMGCSCSSLVWLTSPFRRLSDSSLCHCTRPLCGCSVTKKAMLTLHTDNCVEASVIHRCGIMLRQRLAVGSLAFG